MNDVFSSLADEYAALGSMLASLDEAAWETESLCPGWSVSDVVLHLAQSEESVLASMKGEQLSRMVTPGATTMDEVVEGWVAGERGRSRKENLDRWLAASSASLGRLREADPSETFAWATNPLKPRTLATTRLSEHWIHANDIAQPLGVDYPDTHRIWHIARLAQRTVPYAYARAGRSDPPSVRVELDAPDGEQWSFGDDGADCVVRGAASEFCRIAARRLPRSEAKTISASGDRADEVLELVRTYA